MRVYNGYDDVDVDGALKSLPRRVRTLGVSCQSQYCPVFGQRLFGHESIIFL